MPRACTICTSDNRLHIDQQLIERVPFRNIAARFGISTGALVRHRDKHLPESLKKAGEVDAINHAKTLLGRVEALRDQATGLIDTALESGDHVTAIKAMREVRGLLSLQGQVSGELSSGGVTVNVGFSLTSGLDTIEDRRQRAIKDITPKQKAIANDSRDGPGNSDAAAPHIEHDPPDTV